MKRLLEHIHLNVDSIAATEQFLLNAIPDFKKRGGGNEAAYGKWVHIGDDSTYIALTEVPGTEIPDAFRHIGIVTKDLDGLVNRLGEAGFQPSDCSELDTHPYRRRIYYIDDNGLSWEFVGYLTAAVSQRNDYS